MYHWVSSNIVNASLEIDVMTSLLILCLWSTKSVEDNASVSSCQREGCRGCSDEAIKLLMPFVNFHNPDDVHPGVDKPSTVNVNP